MNKQPINTINVVDALLEHESDKQRIYGSHVRGTVTKSFTRYDVPHIISQDPGVIPLLMKICRKVSFVPLVSEKERRSGRVKADNPSLVMLTCKFDEDISEEDDEQEDGEIYGYLTKADLKEAAGFASLWVPNRKLFVDRLNKDEELDFAPDVADSVNLYTHKGMRFYIHLIPPDVAPEDYIKVMSDRSVSFLANNAFFRKGKVVSTDPRSVIDLEKKVIRFKGATPRAHAAATELKEQGWTIAKSIDPSKPVRKSLAKKPEEEELVV